MNPETPETPPRGEPDRLIGTVLAGRYRIHALLGEGAMGAVYLGEHLKIGRKDALKVLRPSMANDAEAIARFTRGARNASGIRHRNVCAIYDFGTTDEGMYFLAMEYVEGGTLNSLLDELGRIPEPRASSILHQAAGALQVAHDRGIIHRDLKPDNIMLARESDGSDLVKVVDFDISLGPPEGEGARVTRHGYVVGTPEYMSPEQLTGDPLGPASDVYSLALVYFRMLTGRLPFDGGTAQQVMVNRLTVDPLALHAAAPDAALPPALEAVLRRALERRAEDRFGSAAEFSRAVRQVTGGEPEATVPPPGRSAAPAAPPPPTGPPPPRGHAGGPIPPTRVSSSGDEPGPAPDPAPTPPGGVRRPLVLAGAGAVALLAVVVLGAIFFLPGGDDGTEQPVAMEASPPEEEDEPVAEPTPSDDPTGAQGQAAPGPPASPPADDAEPVTRADPDLEPESPPATPQPSPGAAMPPYPPARATIDLSGLHAGDLLIRQLIVGTEEEGASRAALAAVRDSAFAVWAEATVSRADSALAAYLIGSTLIPLGDSIPGVRWLEEAVRLDPQRGYVSLLENHRGGDMP